MKQAHAMRFSTCARQAGLSLVELMVGMLVGLIGIVIISHLYITNEKYKRSTTGAGAAQVNGAVALYTIERDLRMAGYGINHPSALGCGCDTGADAKCSPVRYYFNGTPQSPPAVPELRTLQIAPVVIIKNTLTNQPDSITVLYGGNNERSVPSKLLQAMASPNYDYNPDGTAGFEVNDLIVVTQLGGVGGDTCALAQITTVNPSASLLSRVAGTYNPNQNGSLPVFLRDAMVFNLGRSPGSAPGTNPGNTPPVWRTFTIENNKLVATEVLPPQGGARQELVDDIVDLQALYGKDLGVHLGHVAEDRIVDTYNALTPTTAADWQQVYAVRIAVLARSQNYEQPTAAGVCQATTIANQPMWGRTAAAPAGTVFPTLQAAGALPSCYKYRVFETIVPLRNMIWR